MELHLKRLVDLHRAELKKEQLQEQLQTAKEQIAENYRLEFSVPRDLLGLVIGKKGRNIIAAEKMEGIVKYASRPHSLSGSFGLDFFSGHAYFVLIGMLWCVPGFALRLVRIITFGESSIRILAEV